MKKHCVESNVAKTLSRQNQVQPFVGPQAWKFQIYYKLKLSDCIVASVIAYGSEF